MKQICENCKWWIPDDPCIWGEGKPRFGRCLESKDSIHFHYEIDAPWHLCFLFWLFDKRLRTKYSWNCPLFKIDKDKE